MLRVRFVFVVLWVFMFLFFSLFLAEPVLCYSEGEAKAEIAVAESEVLRCYNAVFEAEKAGANVSELLIKLNEAGWLLSRARLAYDYGDFDSAFRCAEDCVSMLDGVVGQADVLRVEAEQAAYYDFMVNFVGSGVGALVVLVGGFGVWVFLKRHEESGRGV